MLGWLFIVASAKALSRPERYLFKENSFLDYRTFFGTHSTYCRIRIGVVVVDVIVVVDVVVVVVAGFVISSKPHGQ